MPIRMKRKSYGPLTIASNQENRFIITTQNGHSHAAGFGDSDEFSAPSDLIMSALGSCLAISLEMAAAQQKVRLGAMNITVDGEKASTLPNRFDSFNVQITLPDFQDREAAKSLIKAAKEMCTVSNTLNAEVHLTLT